jgi:hypothetical protein
MIRRKELRVRPHLRTLVVLLVLVAVASTTVVAQKVKPQPPPPTPTPFALAAGLNIVTAELGPRVRSWQVDPTISSLWSETRSEPYRDIALADVDDDAKNELVVPGACAADGVVYVWLEAYKQGHSGAFYSGACDPAQRVPAGGFVRPEVIGFDLDGDRRDEVVLRTQSDSVVFKLDGSGKWYSTAQVSLSDVAPPVDLGPEGFTGRSLAVGNVDADPDLEIITTANYYYTPDPDSTYRATRTYLLVFDSWLVLKDSVDFGLIGVEDLCVGYAKSVHLADTDGDGTKEIWVAGWTNNNTRTSYRQRVLSFRATGGLALAANWDLGWTDALGPYISTGHLFGPTVDGIARDQIVLSYLAQNDNSVRVYDGAHNELWSFSGWLGGVQRAYVVNDGNTDRLVVGGLMAGAKKLKKGLFFEVWDSDGSSLTRSLSYGVGDDSETWTFNVGFGIKQ